MNNTFQLQKATTTTNSTVHSIDNNDKISFKESITGIEKFWNELNTELEKKNKDIQDLNRMYQEYQTEDFSNSIDIITNETERIKYKLNMIQRIIWDVRTRILFTEF
jgi:predicted  nucleic acid-binding Zn-ribbon protein